VIAVCADGPKRGLEIILVGQSATETTTVASPEADGIERDDGW
jgi:hypothetical protein